MSSGDLTNGLRIMDAMALALQLLRKPLADPNIISEGPHSIKNHITWAPIARFRVGAGFPHSAQSLQAMEAVSLAYGEHRVQVPSKLRIHEYIPQGRSPSLACWLWCR